MIPRLFDRESLCDGWTQPGAYCNPHPCDRSVDVKETPYRGGHVKLCGAHRDMLRRLGTVPLWRDHVKRRPRV